MLWIGTKYALFLALVIFVGCVYQTISPKKNIVRPSRNLAADITFYGSEAIKPKSEWYIYHREVTGCLNITLPYNDIKWFVADSVILVPHDSTQRIWKAAGVFIHPDTIYIKRERLDTSFEKWVVRHELIHYITQKGHDELPGIIFSTCAYLPSAKDEAEKENPK